MGKKWTHEFVQKMHLKFKFLMAMIESYFEFLALCLKSIY